MWRVVRKVRFSLALWVLGCSGSDGSSTSHGPDSHVASVTTTGPTSGAVTAAGPAGGNAGATVTTIAMATSVGGATANTVSVTSNTGGATLTGAGGNATSATTTGAPDTTTAGAGAATSMASGGASSSDTGGSGAGGTSMTAPDCEGGKVVHFVYFVESDATYSESQAADIEAQAYAFQQYWYEQLGVTFYLNWPVVDVIEADHASDWYLTTPDGIHSDERWYRLGNVKNEVYDKLGIQNFDPNHRVVNYPTTRHDGRVGANFGGAWMDGDDLSCMAEESGVNYPYDDANAAHCMGHVAHEFGHVLGLDHQGPQTDCMQFGFYNSSGGSGMCGFSAENVAQILAEPDNQGWFDAQPGDTCVGL